MNVNFNDCRSRYCISEKVDVRIGVIVRFAAVALSPLMPREQK